MGPADSLPMTAKQLLLVAAVAGGLATAVLGSGCAGNDDGGGPDTAPSSGGLREMTHDPERVARCITRSGTLLTDPLAERPVHLSPALRQQADKPERMGVGSILPRPTAFVAFAGFDATFVPRGLNVREFVPAAFVVFPTADAARRHARDADLRRGNILIVYRGQPSAEQRRLIERCI
jgi:hypothetical protein